MKSFQKIDNYRPIFNELFINLINGNPDERYEIINSGKGLRINILDVLSEIPLAQVSYEQSLKIRDHISTSLLKLGWQKIQCEPFAWEYKVLEYEMFGECPLCNNKFDRWEFVGCFCRVCGERLEPKEKSARDYIRNYKYSLILS